MPRARDPQAVVRVPVTFQSRVALDGSGGQITGRSELWRGSLGARAGPSAGSFEGLGGEGRSISTSLFMDAKRATSWTIEPPAARQHHFSW